MPYHPSPKSNLSPAARRGSVPTYRQQQQPETPTNNSKSVRFGSGGGGGEKSKQQTEQEMSPAHNAFELINNNNNSNNIISNSINLNSSANVTDAAAYDDMDRHTVSNNSDDSDRDNNNPDIGDGSSSGDDGMASSAAGTNSTDSNGSGGSDKAFRAKKSTLPCGMTMPVMMGVLILIPIIFLVAYTGDEARLAVASQNLLADHRFVFDDILFIATRLQECRRDSTMYLASAPNSSEAATLQIAIQDVRRRSNARVKDMLNRMQESDLDGKKQFIEKSQKQIDELSAARQRVDDRTISIPDMVEYLLLLIEEVFGLMNWIAKDPRGKPLESRIIMFIAVRRIGNSLGLMRGLGPVILRGQASSHINKIMKIFYAMHMSITRDILFVKTAGSDEAIYAVESWENSPEANRFWEMTTRIESEDPAIWNTTNATEYLQVANALYKKMDEALVPVIDVITNGQILNKEAIEQGMKMFGAVFVCLIACCLVIYYNNKEQKRMEKALDATAVLAAAVQRFVPKHQLKTMGMRSITQVQPGMTTEVAQTIIFSDIRGFTRLAESMTRLELFDWLQSYVARMTKVVSEEKSYISNFLGDGLMIISNFPTDGCNAAIKMHVAVDTLNLELVAAGGKRPITIGVGLHYGVVVAGVFGDQSRLTATFVATDVNLASRLESLTKSFGSKILASENVTEQLNSDVFSFRNVGKVQVSGSAKPMQIYDVYQSDSLDVQNYKDETKKDFEAAINLCETDPAAALDALYAIADVADSKGIYDKALESRIQGAQSALMNDESMQSDVSGAASQQSIARSGVLEFEKDGEMRRSGPIASGENSGGRISQQLQRSPRSAHLQHLTSPDVSRRSSAGAFHNSNNNNNTNNNNNNGAAPLRRKFGSANTVPASYQRSNDTNSAINSLMNTADLHRNNNNNNLQQIPGRQNNNNNMNKSNNNPKGRRYLTEQLMMHRPAPPGASEEDDDEFDDTESLDNTPQNQNNFHRQLLRRQSSIHRKSLPLPSTQQQQQKQTKSNNKNNTKRRIKPHNDDYDDLTFNNNKNESPDIEREFSSGGKTGQVVGNASSEDHQRSTSTHPIGNNRNKNQSTLPPPSLQLNNNNTNTIDETNNEENDDTGFDARRRSSVPEDKSTPLTQHAAGGSGSKASTDDSEKNNNQKYHLQLPSERPSVKHPGTTGNSGAGVDADMMMFDQERQDFIEGGDTRQN